MYSRETTDLQISVSRATRGVRGLDHWSFGHTVGRHCLAAAGIAMVMGCASAVGGDDVVAGLGSFGAEEFSAGDADAAEVERILDLLLYQREEFEPTSCTTAPEGAFTAVLGGELYSLPAEAFVIGRPARGRAASASAGCPESPFFASAFTFSPTEVSDAALEGLHVTVITNDRQRALDRRSVTVLTLAASDVCRPAAGAENFFQCDVAERVFDIPEPITYFFAADADAPPIGGAPFAIRCINRPVERPCSIVDRLDENALIGVDYDPRRVGLSDVVDLYEEIRTIAFSYQRGLPI